MVNDHVARRMVKNTSLDDGTVLVSSEFSLPSLASRDRLISHLFDQSNKQDSQLAEKVLKVSACLMTVTAGHGAYASLEP